MALRIVEGSANNPTVSTPFQPSAEKNFIEITAIKAVAIDGTLGSGEVGYVSATNIITDGGSVGGSGVGTWYDSGMGNAAGCQYAWRADGVYVKPIRGKRNTAVVVTATMPTLTTSGDEKIALIIEYDEKSENN